MYLTCFCPIPESTIDRWASPHDRYNGYGWELGSEMVGREKKKGKKNKRVGLCCTLYMGGEEGVFLLFPAHNRPQSGRSLEGFIARAVG